MNTVQRVPSYRPELWQLGLTTAQVERWTAAVKKLADSASAVRDGFGAMTKELERWEAEWRVKLTPAQRSLYDELIASGYWYVCEAMRFVEKRAA